MKLKLRGSLARVTIKVGLFAAICVVLLAILAKEVGNLSFFTHRVSYKADMPNVTGLFPTDDVKVAGVKVGQVSKVTTDHGHAVVTFNVDKTVPLRSSTQVGLRYRNGVPQYDKTLQTVLGERPCRVIVVSEPRDKAPLVPGAAVAEATT